MIQVLSFMGFEIKKGPAVILANTRDLVTGTLIYYCLETKILLLFFSRLFFILYQMFQNELILNKFGHK